MGQPTVKTAESIAVHVRLTRAPAGVLRPFVRTVWAMDQAVSSRPGISDRECVLPTGGVHLAFRLSDRPVRLFEDPGDLAGRLVGVAVVGGPRVTLHSRRLSARSFRWRPTLSGRLRACFRRAGRQTRRRP